jgi:predicted nuclease of predicted toxin-antitoxin system
VLDQGLAPNAAALLRLDGWDAVHVSEMGLSRAEDKDIINLAREEGRTCVTLDHDFHTHLALTRADGPSVVLIRTEGLDSFQQADLIRRVWASCAVEIELGAAISADRRTIRIRRLPLRSGGSLRLRN